MDSNNKNSERAACLACACPCEKHKEHTCAPDSKESPKACMACSCPCDAHKEHTHSNGKQ